MESKWRTKLKASGWPERALNQFHFFLAKDTLALYNRLIERCRLYCLDQGCLNFPYIDQGTLVGFLCSLADKSDRPQSQLKCALAAMSHLFQAYEIPDLSNLMTVRHMMTALVKSGTVKGRQRSRVLPIKPFTDMFSSWPENELLDIRRLRLKCITLLALAMMLRPSDIAPKAQLFHAETKESSQVVLSVDDIKFESDGTASVFLHGTKNDTDRSGFKVVVPQATNMKVDPVDALRVYISKTNLIRPESGAVFLPLRPPYKAITHSTVASVLNEAIGMAGLDTTKFKAKDFRPTGATVQVANGFDPNVVMKMGRWKTSSVFFEHYVHSQTPSTYTDALLQDH